MAVAGEPNALMLNQDEREVLFGALLNVDERRLDVERFRRLTRPSYEALLRAKGLSEFDGGPVMSLTRSR